MCSIIYFIKFEKCILKTFSNTDNLQISLNTDMLKIVRVQVKLSECENNCLNNSFKIFKVK